MVAPEYTVKEAAQRLRVHRETVLRWIKAGKLEGAYLDGEFRKGGYRIPARVIDSIALGGYLLRDGGLQLPMIEGWDPAGDGAEYRG